MSPTPALSPPPEAAVPARHPRAVPPGTPLAGHNARCFACGEDLVGGLHMRLLAGEGVSVTAELDLTDCHQGNPGMAHGGLLACAMDEALGSVSWLLRARMVTGRLETDFHRPAHLGSTLYIAARCDAVAGRKVYVSGEARADAPDGPVTCTSAALFIIVGREQMASLQRPGEKASTGERRRPGPAVRGPRAAGDGEIEVSL